MSSLLTFQLGQQQQKVAESQCGLPSPPNSFCGEESSQTSIAVERRNSLQTVFNDMTIKDYSTSLPENYTIDHSTIKRNIHTPIAIATATAAATGGLTIRNRRQSEANIGGRRKSRGLSESFNGQYRCNDCGKSYKHPNCLQKHRWEHSEEWEVTKKLSLTKHQQVQMLEAAAILIGMDRRIEPNFAIKNDDFDENDQNRIEIKIEEDEIRQVNNNNNNNNSNNNNNNNEEYDDDEENESIIIDDDDDLDRLSTISDSSSIFMEDL
ncbi:hypothetical protein BD770DRAFT_398423 [Pilaira anomala]|nr:hypothetical protein BD770DRAFT_398423 [Pilaira anomala]